MKCVEPPQDDVLSIVFALDQRASIVFAERTAPRWTGNQIVDRVAIRALTAGCQPVQQTFRGNLKVNHRRLRQSKPGQKVLKKDRLLLGPRKTIQNQSASQGAVRGIPAQPRRNHGTNRSIVHQRTGSQHALQREPCRRRAVRFCPQHLARR